jgi:hypothetical protein
MTCRSARLEQSPRCSAESATTRASSKLAQRATSTTVRAALGQRDAECPASVEVTRGEGTDADGDPVAAASAAGGTENLGLQRECEEAGTVQQGRGRMASNGVTVEGQDGGGNVEGVAPPRVAGHAGEHRRLGVDA